MEAKTKGSSVQLIRANGKRLIWIHGDGNLSILDTREKLKSVYVKTSRDQIIKLVLAGLNLAHGKSTGFATMDAAGTSVTLSRGPKSILVHVVVKTKQGSRLEYVEMVNLKWLRLCYRFFTNKAFHTKVG